MKKVILLVIWFFVLAGSLQGRPSQTKRMVAVTIDDLPVNSKLYPQAEAQKEITQRLLKGLTENAIPAIGFVNEKKLYKKGKIDPGKVEILQLWLQAGMDLGNHTYSHPDLHKVPVNDFIKDIAAGEVILRPLMKKYKKQPVFFRHPYLHTGRTVAIKRRVEQFLYERKYVVAPVTIDNSEWIFAFAYERALKKGDGKLAEKIVASYIEYMNDMFAYYEDQSQKLFGYEIRQILLIHANILNSRTIRQLAATIKKRGYTFISLARALEDRVYTSLDTYTGPGGITWIHRYAITKGQGGKIFAGEPQVPPFISEMVQGSYK